MRPLHSVRRMRTRPDATRSTRARQLAMSRRLHRDILRREHIAYSAMYERRIATTIGGR